MSSPKTKLTAGKKIPGADTAGRICFALLRRGAVKVQDGEGSSRSPRHQSIDTQGLVAKIRAEHEPREVAEKPQGVEDVRQSVA